MAYRPPVQIISELARRYRLDPAAVIAVARGEGGLANRPGWEDIGDRAGGGSYGPFQLYAQGALPARFRGNPQAADAWAWSPAGIDYALRQMAAKGASGLTGRAAVDRIVREFERPANPDKSVAAAWARLGAPADGAAASTMPASSGGVRAVATGGNPSVDARRQLAMQLLQSRRSGAPRDVGTLVQAAVAARSAPEAPDAAPVPAGATPRTRGGSGDRLLGELGLLDAVTSGDRPGAVTARGGVSDHSRPGKARDINPRDPDFGKLVAYARANPSAFKDFIYSGLPWFIDEGRLYPITKLNAVDRGNHGDHAHVSWR